MRTWHHSFREGMAISMYVVEVQYKDYSENVLILLITIYFKVVMSLLYCILRSFFMLSVWYFGTYPLPFCAKISISLSERCQLSAPKEVSLKKLFSLYCFLLNDIQSSYVKCVALSKNPGLPYRVCKDKKNWTIWYQ